MSDSVLPLVFDTGAGSIRAGYAGYDTPHCVLPTFIGSAMHDTPILKCANIQSSKKLYYGDDVHFSKSLVDFKQIIRKGFIIDYDGLEHLWKYILDEKLQCELKDRCLLLTGTPAKNLKSKQKSLEHLFEGLNVSSASIQTSQVLALYGLGLTTGLVLDCGHHESYAVGIYDGFSIDTSLDLQNTSVCGEDLTYYLSQLLTNQGICLQNHTNSHMCHLQLVRDIKEKLCYVSRDYLTEYEFCAKETPCGRNYELPDGTIVQMTTQLFQCPEALFQPSLLGFKKETLGIHNILHQKIINADINLRRYLAQSIILIGGTTFLPSFAERLGMELSRLCPKSLAVKITAPPDRNYVTWTGGSIVASLSTFPSQCITKEMFYERGY
jgi:actin, other eukaryote